MEYTTISVSIEDAVATVRLSRPDARNALDFAMCRELTDVMEALAANDAVRVVMVAATGTVFCAGADLKERKGMTEAETVARRVAAFAAYSAIETLPQPAIAVVQGPSIGSGCEIAAACDFIVASSAASFRYPEVGWGTIGATQRLPRIVGPRVAKELLWTGRTIDAAEAKALGLVNIVCAPEELDATVAALARRIADAPPLAVRLSKRCVDQGLASSREGAMAIELAAIGENLRATDWKRAIDSFGRRDDHGR